MPYSAHRPGRFDSQGNMLLDGSPDGPEEELEFIREYRPAGSEEADPEPAVPAGASQLLAPMPFVDFTVAGTVDALAPAAPPANMTSTMALPVSPAPSQPMPEAQPAAAASAPASPRLSAPAAPAAPAQPQRISPLTGGPVAAPRYDDDEDYAPSRPGGLRGRLRTLAILGGADGEVIDAVPLETTRYVQMFFVLAGTALVSAISMLFALSTGAGASLWIAAPLAVVWLFIIFNLDRFLTSTMGSTTKVLKLIGLAIPRIVMAVIIGFVVAEPLVLQIFNNDIAQEVATSNISQSLEDQEALDSGPEKSALDAATERLNALENQAATGIVTGTDPMSAGQAAAQSTVDGLTQKLADQQLVIDQARALYQCELTGEGVGEVPGCTGLSGEGASSDAAKAQLAQAQQSYDALAGQLRTANEGLESASASAKDVAASSEQQNRELAEQQLPAARETHEAALAAYNARADSVAQGNAGATGLLSQITALNALSEREPTILWAHWLIAALFFMIELLPVLVKVLTSYGEKTLYERAAQVRKEVALDRVTAEGFRERAAIVNGTGV
ncbi:DUF4407 domain-containing protein [Microbacterium sp. GXF6406]